VSLFKTISYRKGRGGRGHEYFLGPGKRNYGWGGGGGGLRCAEIGQLSRPSKDIAIPRRSRKDSLPKGREPQEKRLKKRWLFRPGAEPVERKAIEADVEEGGSKKKTEDKKRLGRPATSKVSNLETRVLGGPKGGGAEKVIINHMAKCRES